MGHLPDRVHPVTGSALHPKNAPRVRIAFPAATHSVPSSANDGAGRGRIRETLLSSSSGVTGQVFFKLDVLISKEQGSTRHGRHGSWPTLDRASSPAPAQSSNGVLAGVSRSCGE